MDYEVGNSYYIFWNYCTVSLRIMNINPTRIIILQYYFWKSIAQCVNAERGSAILKGQYHEILPSNFFLWANLHHLRIWLWFQRNILIKKLEFVHPGVIDTVVWNCFPLVQIWCVSSSTAMILLLLFGCPFKINPRSLKKLFCLHHMGSMTPLSSYDLFNMF